MHRAGRTLVSRVGISGIVTVLATAIGVLAPVTLRAPAAQAAQRLAPGSPMSDITSAPVRPAHCTKEQIAAVDFDNCALMVDGTPNNHGFPEPPFPGKGIVTTPITSEEWTPLAAGASGPIVVLLQQQLLLRDQAELTVTNLIVDGKFGPTTTDSVKREQTRELLEPTGIVDAVLAQALGILVKAEIGPFPGAGWVWTGSSWSGSVALSAWESRMVKGTVKTDPLASGIFEGFLADLRRGTYRIDEAGTYSFRCTATTVRNCKGLTASQLSYHAWGLAVDVNYSTNPLQMVYHSSDACNASTKHAMPNWVLKTAQHWGLFWGGWYSCPKAGQKAVVKDPHHFEFRGTPETAAAIIAKNTAAEATPAPVPELADLLLACGDRGASVGQIRDLLPESYRPVEAASQRNTFTATLAAAIGHWQKDQGLPVTGTFDPATATALGITVRHTEKFPVLHRNSCGDWVKKLQSLLGLAQTGTVGSTTMSTLRTWQSKHGLAPTGVTDTSTAAALGLKLPTAGGPPDDSTTTTAPEPGTSDAPAPVTVIVPLGYQARGSSVSALQRALTDAGFPTTVDGRFGSNTVRALRAFQQAKGLKVTSSVTIQTAQALGLAPVPKLPLRIGQRGDHVLLLQQALKARGYRVPTSGKFGSATKRAVVSFQRKHKIRATGVVTSATARALGW